MIGIDDIIDDCKTVLDARLWLSPLTYTAYGRAFINERDGRKIPEILTSTGTEGYEYSEMKLNDTIDAASYFIVDGKIKMEKDTATAEVTIYFAVNLKKCYSAITERAVEYVHRDVAAVLKHTDFTLTGIEAGWGDFESDYQNMQPYYLVRFITSLTWLLD